MYMAKNHEAGAARAIIRSKNKSGSMKFLRTRMWINYLLSAFQKDRGKIPTNIGDKILITNNMYITKYFMSSTIQIKNLSLDTPITFAGDIVRYLRMNDCDAVVDVTLKNEKNDIKLKDSGLASRIEVWEKIIDSDTVSAHEREVAARCLYTRDQVRDGAKLVWSRIFVTIRTKTGSKLMQAEKLVFEYLNKINAEYTLLVGDLKEKLGYMLILSDKRTTGIADSKAIVNSMQTMAQMLPNSSAFNGTETCYLGYDVLNYRQFMIDWNKFTTARNIYLVAPSGVGKTVFGINACCSAVEAGLAVCVQDIKGNEFTNFIRATGGYIVSLRQTSSGYINSWKMIKEDTTDEQAEMYFKQRVQFSKEQMLILSGVSATDERVELEELLDLFHDSLYVSIGVLATNRNTWKQTMELNPFVVYEHLVQFLTPEMQRKYPAVTRKILNNLRMTMSREGSKSYIFNQEFSYADILKAPTLMFDFGILDGATSLVDPMLFRLKFMYMRKLNADFIAYKYSKGIKVFKVLEEAQIARSGH